MLRFDFSNTFSKIRDILRKFCTNCPNLKHTKKEHISGYDLSILIWAVWVNLQQKGQGKPVFSNTPGEKLSQIGFFFFLNIGREIRPYKYVVWRDVIHQGFSYSSFSCIKKFFQFSGRINPSAAAGFSLVNVVFFRTRWPCICSE